MGWTNQLRPGPDRDRNYSGRPESYHEAKVRKASEIRAEEEQP